MTRIQLRRDTAANWVAKNPIPAQGEPCYETDTRKLKIGDGSTKYNNLSYIEGGGSSGGGTTTTVSDNGIRGDYESRYGIIDSPNGILTDSQDSDGNLILTLHQGLMLQCAGQDAKTTISADTIHIVESTTEFDLFYAAGAFYEAAEVVFSETEPAGSDTGITAWFNPNKTANPDQKWQFKSNTNGNTWASAAAGRIAHIHTNGTAITRIDYAGCRILDGQHFLSATEAAHAVMPSKKKIILDLPESGKPLAAPADGYLFLNMTGATGWLSCTLDNKTVGYMTTGTDSEGAGVRISIMVNKNDLYEVRYNKKGTQSSLAFIYTNGSAPKD